VTASLLPNIPMPDALNQRENGCVSRFCNYGCLTGHCLVVCTENLNPNVLTMKSAQYGARIYDAGSLNLARDRRILVQ
jgi:hypothetical protein